MRGEITLMRTPAGLRGRMVPIDVRVSSQCAALETVTAPSTRGVDAGAAANTQAHGSLTRGGGRAFTGTE